MKTLKANDKIRLASWRYPFCAVVGHAFGPEHAEFLPMWIARGDELVFATYAGSALVDGGPNCEYHRQGQIAYQGCQVVADGEIVEVEGRQYELRVHPGQERFPKFSNPIKFVPVQVAEAPAPEAPAPEASASEAKVLAETTMKQADVPLEVLAEEIFAVWDNLRNSTVAYCLLRLAVEGRGWIFAGEAGDYQMTREECARGLFAISRKDGRKMFYEDGKVVVEQGQPKGLIRVDASYADRDAYCAWLLTKGYQGDETRQTVSFLLAKDLWKEFCSIGIEDLTGQGRC